MGHAPASSGSMHVKSVLMDHYLTAYNSGGLIISYDSLLGGKPSTKSHPASALQLSQTSSTSHCSLFSLKGCGESWKQHFVMQTFNLFQLHDKLFFTRSYNVLSQRQSQGPIDALVLSDSL